jgi:hypothetical protein
METTEDRRARSLGILFPRGRAVVVDQNRKDLQDYTGLLRRPGFEVSPFTE